ncbi:hypothetical protein J2X31_003210 [Flavobacterium arsenatis]|uniref:Uncharacterized protein n=1 Tax=Flavobacterium arsenatis TaxID=1484332 RepID=A0ABU1TTH9_9FLAO|nr:hypothetical protein [Flavobacterium arsenatis]MDR6969183.1 hypothetical protein [Flavobacterium arsenatis]
MNSNIKIKKGQIEDYAVQKTGDQTISGRKNFTTSPRVPHATDPSSAVNLEQTREEIFTKFNPLNQTMEDFKIEIDTNEQIAKTANFTLSDSHHKVTIFCNSSTSTINITVPDNLRSDFVCFLFNQNTAVVNVIGSGLTTIVAPDGAILEHHKRGMIEQIMGSKNFLVTGEFS